jgi:hypothetical protein
MTARDIVSSPCTPSIAVTEIDEGLTRQMS